MPRRPDEILDQMAETFRERNKVYGDGYKRAGEVLRALFPDGVTLETEADFLRFHIVVLEAVKLYRYANSFSSGGHPDSSIDLGVYAAMIASVDSEENEG